MTSFITPASPANARKSLESPIDRKEVEKALRDRAKFAALIEDIGNARPAYCWAVRASKEGIFRKMKKGDEVLFGITGSGRFDFIGTITSTLLSERFAAEFWQDSDLMDWPCVFFMKDVREIDLPKARVRKLLGYDETDRFQGLRPVLEHRLKGASSIAELAKL